MIYHFDDAAKFYHEVKDYLLNHEAENCLLLSICESLLHQPEQYNEKRYLASVEVEGNIAAVAIKTPSNKLLLSKMADFAAVELIAQDLHSQQQQLSGVRGLVAEADAFVDAWQTLTSQPYQLGMQLRIHRLQAVQPITRAKGYLRNITEEDRPLLIEWSKAFGIEALGTTQGDPQRFVDYNLKENSLFIWEDEVPVSMLGYSGSTPNSKRIGSVYTPPEYRGKGYATTCVADVSQKLLKEGWQFCCLLTDLANPTSNHIYKKIGYQVVADWNEYSFV